MDPSAGSHRSDPAGRLLFVIDPIHTLDPTHDTSVALMEAAQRAGHTVLVTTMPELEIRHGRAAARCREVRLVPAQLSGESWRATPDWYSLGPTDPYGLDDVDAILVRSDPPVDRAYLRVTYLLDLVDDSRTVVLNSARGLRGANEKIFALQFPDLCPPSLVTNDIDAIIEQASEWDVAVVKPTDGMAGRGVLLVRPKDPNVHSMLEIATNRGADHIIVQRYLPEAHDGDRRVIVLDGEPIGSVRRVAAPGEFRCNMAAGASALADRVQPVDHAICARLRPKLREHGLPFVGIDVIGEYLIEINVTSPTGVREIEAVSGTPVCSRVIGWIERSIASRRRGPTSTR